MNTLKVTNSNGLSFNVRIVRKGDTYGLNNCLTYDEDTAMVEFYDTRYNHTPLGQFVSRYCVTTILERLGQYAGLNLDCGIEAWTIDAAAMDIVRGWIHEECVVNA